VQRYNKKLKYANFFAFFLKKIAFFLHLSIFICNFVGFFSVFDQKAPKFTCLLATEVTSCVWIANIEVFGK